MFKNLRLFLEYLRQYKKHFWTGTIALIFVNLLDVTPPLIIKYGIDHLTSPDAYRHIFYAAIAYIAVVVTQAFFRYFMRMGFYGMSLYVGVDLRNKLSSMR
ncbi:MAG: hypothetical protein HY762_02495 [Planctomycetes bacterium]|nr:hypothetical protein [Planctomycetota bacterium]